jgi:hypothetical protein
MGSSPEPARAVDLLDHDKAVLQLVGLERRTARGGRDSIDHAPGAHDDIANAIAGSLSLANELRGNYLDFRRQPKPLRAPIVIPRWRQTDPLNPNTNWMMRR